MDLPPHAAHKLQLDTGLHPIVIHVTSDTAEMTGECRQLQTLKYAKFISGYIGNSQVVHVLSIAATSTYLVSVKYTGLMNSL